MRNIKNKEGVVFTVVKDPNVAPQMREKESVKFITEHILVQLNHYGVNPINNKIGFHGDKEALAYYLGGLIDTFNETYSTVKQIGIEP